MNTLDAIHDVSAEPANTPLGKDQKPWHAKDGAVRDAVAMFNFLLDDSPDQNQNDRQSPDGQSARPASQNVPSQDSDSPANTPGAGETPKTPSHEERHSCRESSDSPWQPEEHRRADSRPEYTPAAPPVARAAETTVPAAAQPAENCAMETVCREIADRVLVSSSQDASAAGEVRLLIRDSVLPQTEIRISHQAGELCVSIITGSAESHALLIQNKQTLDQRLADRLGNARVDVVLASDRQNDDQQGRSRQRRSVFDEQEG